MKKVIVSREQAEAIEKMKPILKRLSANELHRVVVQGDYKVKTEFRYGDYLYDEQEGDVFVLRNQMMAEALNRDDDAKKYYRHATPAEKAMKQIKSSSY